jgi:aryl-alcohol dehydrogenase-like predicted oxidoreductase
VTQQHDIDVIAHPHHLLDQASGREVIELAAMSNIALFATDPLAGDRLTGSGERAPVEAFQFVLEDRESATLAQVAIKWLLADPQTATVVVTATTNEDLAERAASCDVEEFDADELGELATLHDLSFGVALA